MTDKHPVKFDYEILDAKKRLSDSELDYLLSFHNTLRLDNLESITDRQAEMLSNLKVLVLGNVREITNRQAEFLGRIPELILGLTAITDSQAKSFSKCKCVCLISLKSITACLLYTSPSPRDQRGSRMPSSA